MTDFDASLADHHEAIEQVTATARDVSPAIWKTPREEGKWSPAQVVEHLALTYEYNARVLSGTAGKGAPRFLRPLIRRAFITPALKAGRFTRKGKAPKTFQPGPGSPAPADGIARFTAAASAFESALRASRPQAVQHPFFGTLTAIDYLKLQAMHTRHHGAQLPAVQAAGSST